MKAIKIIFQNILRRLRVPPPARRVERRMQRGVLICVQFAALLPPFHLASAAEFEVIDRLAVGSTVTISGNVGIGTAAVGGARLAVIGPADAAYSLAVGTSANYNFSVSTAGVINVSSSIYRGDYKFIDTSMLDGFTLKIDTATNKIKLADRIEENIMRNAFQAAVLSSMSIYGMVDGIADEFEDQNGIDLNSSSGYAYNSGGAYYSPSTGTTVDSMEYTSDNDAQTAYVTSDIGSSDSYTKLFLHCNGANGSTSFVDSSPNKYSVSSNGGAQITTTQYKFGGASGYFDGVNDYLSLDGSDDWYFGTGDFTIDYWVRFNSLASQGMIAQQLNANNYWRIITDGNGLVYFEFVYGGVTKAVYYLSLSGAGVTAGTWCHLAFERAGTGAKIFVNGVSQTLQEGVAFGTNDVGNIANILQVGAQAGGALYLNGWLDEFRVSKGLARWTTNFTPPRGPDEYTKLLLHFDGDNGSTKFTDEVGKDVTPNGGVQIVTADKKFGTGSGYFNGSTYLSIPDSDDWDLGYTNSWTIDMWTRWQTVGTTYFMGQFVNSSNYWIAQYYTGFLGWGCNATNINIYAWTPSAGIWYHLAWVFNSGDGKIHCYINGNEVGSSALSNMPASLAAELNIGQIAGSCYMNGWIDELRISKGIARWTTNFTPAPAPYMNFQCYSGTVTTQGSYSLKAYAMASNSLNDTLTKTFAAPVNLSGMSAIKFDIQSSRTGSNIEAQIKDAGGAISVTTVSIAAANNWQTVNWDISRVTDTAKDAINQIAFKIIDDTANNLFYIDNMATGPSDMKLISSSFTALSTPAKSRIVLFEEDVDGINDNTDLKAYVSRAGTDTWSAVTLSNEGNYESGKRILSGVTDLSAGTGTSMRWKVTTHQNKNLKLHGVGLTWD